MKTNGNESILDSTKKMRRCEGPLSPSRIFLTTLMKKSMMKRNARLLSKCEAPFKTKKSFEKRHREWQKCDEKVCEN